MRRRRKTGVRGRWIRRIGLVLLGLMVGVGSAEVALRVMGVHYPRITLRDDVTGYRRRPGIAFEFRDEGEAYVKYNSAGFRDSERTLHKADDCVRIAVLGDSYVEALQVPADARVTEQLERLLTGRRAFGGKRIEVLNFGVSGYGTAQEYLLFQSCVASYQPDIVVLCMCTGNDIRNNCEEIQGDPARPYFVFREGRLVLDDSFLQSSEHQIPLWKRAGYWAIDRSRLLQLAYRVRRRLKKARVTSRRMQRYRSLATLREAGIDALIYHEPMSEEWKQAWNVTERLLLMFRDEVTARGATLLVVTLSNAAQVHPDAELRRRFAAELGVPDLRYPDRRIRNWCESHGIEVLNLVPALQEYAEHTGKYLHGFENTTMGKGHWNATGHRLAASLIAARIADRWGNE